MLQPIDISGVNILSQISDNDNVNRVKTGADILSREIRRIADSVFNKGDSNRYPIKNVFIEFSSVALMLSEGKMIGFGALDENNDALFNENVKKYASGIINNLQTHNLSIYSHPSFLSSNDSPKTIIGLPFVSSFDDEFDINVICETLNIEVSDINNISEKQKASGYSWSWKNDFTYEELISSIDNFSKRYENIPPIDNIFTLTKYCYDKAFNKPKQQNSVFLGVPILGSSISDMPIKGQGAIFVYFTYDNQTKKNEIIDFINEIGPSLDFLIKGYIFNLLAYSALVLSNKSKKEATKSAKAAIMSRNMSHNIGSHVMAYLKQHLSSVTNILQDNILSDFISSSSFSELLDRIEQAKKNQDSSVKFIKEMSTEEGSLALPFLVGLGNFISYLQERQDFIATIATDYIPYYSTVNFKDFIYDEINPDKRYLRHKDRKNLQPDNILLGNIARSEGLGRTISPTEKENGKLSDIVIKFRGFDGNPVVNESNIMLKGRQDAYNDLEFMRQIDVSLPGGMVGRQAVFSMLENIIRNAAKHGNWRSQGRLELTFDFIDKEAIEEYGHLITRRFELERLEKERQLTEDEQAEYAHIIEELKERDKDAAPIVDSESDPLGGRDKHKSLMRVLWQFYSESIDADDLYFVTITDNIIISEPAIYKLREALTEGYIDNDSRMIEANKGIKEIRISAAWLRGAKDEEEYFNEVPEDDTIAQTKKKAPLLYIRQHDGHLQYIFCLLIPKQVAVVSESFSNDIKLDDKIRKRLAGFYWKAFTPSEYIKENNKSYNFVLCDGEDCYKLIRPYSSSRIVTISSIEETNEEINREGLLKCIQDGISQKECHRIENCLYLHFSNCEKGNDFICVDDKKAYARFVNQPKVIKYKWIKESGNFIRTQEDTQENVIAKDGLFDGMALIPEHDYCKIGNVIITDGGGFGKYVYRTHHDMNEEFSRFMRELRNNYKGCQFVESVTGNSSTDRLVRNDSLDDTWFYSHLRAMKQQVAIFDERLFAKLYGLEEVDFTRAHAASGTLNDMKQEYIKQFGANFAKEINKCESIDELNKLVSSNPALKKKLYESEADAKSRNVSAYYQKGIYVYTFVRNPQKKNTYGMYGLQLSSTRTDVLDAIEDVYHAKTVKLVDLSWENGSLKITPEPDTERPEYPAKCFDYISIHQGLLDKLYEAFGIKENEDAKVELTRQLYLFLKRGDQSVMDVPKYPGDETSKETQLFMPGIMVHSGRSKPNKKDMPQLMPFIQYAAIEHATLDCKYSLVELLDSARYEE